MARWLGAVLAAWTGTAHGAFDARLVEAVRDLEEGAFLLLVSVSYLLGCVLMGSGLLRLARMSEQPWRGPSGAGTALCLIGAPVMFSFPAWLDAGSETLFGDSAVTSLSYTGAGDEGERYNAMLSAVLAVVQFVGVVGFLKGWFVLRAAADGTGRGTMGSGVWHIVGGLLGWHIKPVINAVQETIGVELLNAG